MNDRDIERQGLADALASDLARHGNLMIAKYIAEKVIDFLREEPNAAPQVAGSSEPGSPACHTPAVAAPLDECCYGGPFSRGRADWHSCWSELVARMRSNAGQLEVMDKLLLETPGLKEVYLELRLGPNHE